MLIDIHQRCLAVQMAVHYPHKCESVMIRERDKWIQDPVELCYWIKHKLPHTQMDAHSIITVQICVCCDAGGGVCMRWVGKHQSAMCNYFWLADSCLIWGERRGEQLNLWGNNYIWLFDWQQEMLRGALEWILIWKLLSPIVFHSVL